MTRKLIFFFLLLSIGSSIVYGQFLSINEVLEKGYSKGGNESFDVKLQLDEIDKDQYNLAVSVELEPGTYIVSPFSLDEVYGHFNISLNETSKLIPKDKLLEIPNSVVEFDPILNEQVRLVRGNTIYKQKMQLVSHEDFKVSGLVEFVLEPICIPYDIEFVLSYNSGKLNVEKIKTSISKEYKR